MKVEQKEKKELLETKVEQKAKKKAGRTNKSTAHAVGRPEKTKRRHPTQAGGRKKVIAKTYGRFPPRPIVQLFAQASPDSASIMTATMIGFFVGSGIIFAMLSICRPGLASIAVLIE